MLLIAAVSIAVATLLEGSVAVAVTTPTVVELATLATSADLAIITLLEVAATLSTLEITLTVVVSLVHWWSFTLHDGAARTRELLDLRV